VNVLTGGELCSLWVVGDVQSQVFELFDRSDEVVEAILLPEAALAIQSAIDLTGSEVLPGVALGKH
jgi:hypothetical protein